MTVSKISPVSNPTVPVHCTTVKTEPAVNVDSTGTVKGFVHKVKVRPDVQPVWMKLRRLLSAYVLKSLRSGGG